MSDESNNHELNMENRISLNNEELKQKINLETGQLSWQELQRCYASGNVLLISSTLDLIEVASAMGEDNAKMLEPWISAALIKRAEDAEAIRWNDNQQEFWSVVVAPWVLVQEIPAQEIATDTKTKSE